MIRSLIITGAVLAAVPSSARAYGIGDALVACASHDDAVLNGIIDHFVGFCSVTKGSKSACQVLAGDPWICNDKDGPHGPPEKPTVCFGGDASIFIKLSGATNLPLKWKIAGEVTAEMQHRALIKDERTCGLKPKIPPTADGAEGKFVALSGELSYYTSFKVGGAVTVTAPNGTTFTVEANGTCNATASASVYRDEATSACKAPKPCEPKKDGTTDALDLVCHEEEPLPDVPTTPGDPTTPGTPGTPGTPTTVPVEAP